MAASTSSGISGGQELLNLTPDARTRPPNSGDQEDALISQPREGHPNASEPWLVNPLPPSRASSSLVDLNISLEELLRYGPTAEEPSVEAPLLRALESSLPASDETSSSFVGSVDASGNFFPGEHESVIPADIEQNERIGSISPTPSRLPGPTDHPRHVSLQSQFPPLPRSDLASLQHTFGSSLEDVLRSDSIPAPPPCEGEEPINIPLPPSPTPQGNSLEDLRRVGYGRMTYIEKIRRTVRYLPHLNTILSSSRNDGSCFLTWYDYVGSLVSPGPIISKLASWPYQRGSLSSTNTIEGWNATQRSHKTRCCRRPVHGVDRLPWFSV